MRKIYSAILLLSVAACAPITPIAPFHFAETAPVLEKGELRSTVTLGGGSLDILGGGSGSGGAGRIRRGMGGHQELGAELVAFSAKNDNEPDPLAPWKGTSSVVAGKLSWKYGFLPWCSLVGGFGASHSAVGGALSGDLGLVASLAGLDRKFTPFIGLRGGIGAKASGGGDENGGHSRGMALAVGASLRTGERSSVLLELGLLSLSNKTYSSGPEVLNRQLQDFDHGGGYAALSLAYSSRPRRLEALSR